MGNYILKWKGTSTHPNSSIWAPPSSSFVPTIVRVLGIQRFTKSDFLTQDWISRCSCWRGQTAYRFQATTPFLVEILKDKITFTSGKPTCHIIMMSTWGEGLTAFPTSLRRWRRWESSSKSVMYWWPRAIVALSFNRMIWSKQPRELSYAIPITTSMKEILLNFANNWAFILN